MNNAFNTAGIAAAWTSVLVFVPKLIAFLLILLLGYFVAKFLGNLTSKALKKVNFEAFLNRAGAGDTLQRAGFQPSRLVGTVVYFAVLIVVLQMAFGVFGPNPISDLLTRVIAFLPHLFVAAGIVVVAAFFAGMVRDIIQAAIGGLSYGRVLSMTASAAIWVLGIFAALNQLQVAPHIVNGLFYAILAIIAGSAIVAIGGGGIQPMRMQWEKALNRIETEAPRLRMEVANSANRASFPQGQASDDGRLEPTPLGYERAAELDERSAA